MGCDSDTDSQQQIWRALSHLCCTGWEDRFNWILSSLARCSRGLVSAVLGTRHAHRLLQGFLLLLETDGLPESRHRARCAPSVPQKQQELLSLPGRAALRSTRRAMTVGEKGQTHGRRGEASTLLTFSSCCSSRAGSWDSCSRTPPGSTSLPPPAPRCPDLGFCCCFFTVSSFVFPFFPFFPFSSLFDPADCGRAQEAVRASAPRAPRGRQSSPHSPPAAS